MQTSRGIFEPTNLSHLGDEFKEAVVGKRFLDLGSGVGHVVEYATTLAASAKGVEYESAFLLCTRVPKLIEQADMFTLELAEYETLYYYVYGSDAEKELYEKIKAEFKGQLIVYDSTLAANEDLVFHSYFSPEQLVKTWDYGKIYSFAG